MLRDLVLQTPPNVTAGSWLDALPELLRSARLGRRISKLDMPMRRELLDLFVKSAGDYLDAWFESAPIKAAYGFDGIVGNYASPYTAGSAYVLLHHVFGEVNGKKGAWGHAIGGMGAISQAMAKAAVERAAWTFECRARCVRCWSKAAAPWVSSPNEAMRFVRAASYRTSIRSCCTAR